MKKVLATIVLAAGIPGRVEVAKKMVDMFRGSYPAGAVAIESTDGDEMAPDSERDWEFRIVVELHLRSEVKLSVGRIDLPPLPSGGDDSPPRDRSCNE